MDRIGSALLEKINMLTGVGRYVIISEDEFFDCFPEGYDANEDRLKKALRGLIAEGYIDLKYSSGNMFCVAPLKKYEPEISPEPQRDAPAPPQSPSGERTKALPLFLAAFAGGLAGSLLISLTFALI